VAELEHLVFCGDVAMSHPLEHSDRVLHLNLDGEDPNVFLEIMDIERRLGSLVPDPVVDLVEIAAYVYCADQVVTRGGEGVLAAGRAWRRRFAFHIPVRRPEIWSSHPVLQALKRTLNFLSDDEYEFRFEQRTALTSLQDYLSFGDQASGTKDIEQVLLFSGGLDSLAGAVQEAVVDKRRVALVSHRSNPKISSRQKQLVEKLHASCKYRPLHVPVWVHRQGPASREYTQRSRSFLYASLAFAVARVLHLDRIRFYENGILSLNLPISEQAVGARATRTTHPQVLNGFAELFSLLLEEDFFVENPFLWRTRAETVNLIGDADCGDLIQYSVSCMHTHEQTTAQPHCGRCSQCVGRRFATLASKYADRDPPNIYKIDLLIGEREVDDCTLLESFIRKAREMKGLTELELTFIHGEIARVLRHVPGLNADDVAVEILNLHRKHGSEVTRVMEEAVAAHATEMLEERLPASCAIILSVPEKYKTYVPESVPAISAVGKNEELDRNRVGVSRSAYSPNDDRIYQLIGEQKFRTLTNHEIQKRFKPQLRKVFGNKKRSLDALRASFNRIRRRWDLPRSQDILKESSQAKRVE